MINKERDVINIVNRVNVLEIKAQEIEAVALAKVAQRNNQQTDYNDKVFIYNSTIGNLQGHSRGD